MILEESIYSIIRRAVNSESGKAKINVGKDTECAAVNIFGQNIQICADLVTIDDQSYC